MSRKPYERKVIESTLLLSVAGIRLPTHPLKPRIPSEDVNPGLKPPSPNEAESGAEAAKRQRSGHVVHMTGANYPSTRFWA